MAGKRRTFAIIQNLIAILISISMLVPLALVLINSVKTKAEASYLNFNMPEEILLSNYTQVIDDGKLVQSFFNSMTYSVCSVILIVLFATMAAFVLARNPKKAHKFLYSYIVLGLTLSLNHIALMNIMKAVQLLDTRIGIILLYTAVQLPFAVFLVYAFIATIPRELDEAAVMDGCGPYKLFFTIVFPMLKPAVVSVGILNFLNTWNEFTLPLYYLGDSKKWPMVNSVYSFYGMYSSSWNLVCADIVLTSIPVVIVYLLGQNYIVDGMTAGAVKG